MTLKIIKMTQPGWEGYTGAFMNVMFTDGVSEPVLDWQAAKIGNLLTVEDQEGSNPSDSQQSIDNKLSRADIAEPMKNSDQIAKIEASLEYTREALEEIASKGGITGLRVITDRMGLKSTSIMKLIELALAFQSAQKREAKQNEELNAAPPAPAEVPVETTPTE